MTSLTIEKLLSYIHYKQIKLKNQNIFSFLIKINFKI